MNPELINPNDGKVNIQKVRAKYNELLRATQNWHAKKTDHRSILVETPSYLYRFQAHEQLNLLLQSLSEAAQAKELMAAAREKRPAKYAAVSIAAGPVDSSLHVQITEDELGETACQIVRDYVAEQRAAAQAEFEAFRQSILDGNGSIALSNPRGTSL